MMRAKTGVLACLAVAAMTIAVVGACDGIKNLNFSFPTAPGAPGLLFPAGQQTPGQTVPSLGGLSQGRLNAARILDGASAIRIEMRQFTGGAQNRCFPLGDGGAAPAWPARFAVGNLTPQALTAEYDLLATSASGDTDYIVSIRSIVDNGLPDDSANFSALEFSFRAVNPHTVGHTLGTDYTPSNITSHVADFPSNDDTPADRSLINLSGGDVAIIVQGISFTGLPANGTTHAFMNFLGPASWLVFLRDNAFQSGRFFRIAGARTNGPPALADDPNFPDGFFRSVQVTGTHFDGLHEPDPANLVVAAMGADTHQLCAGGLPGGLPAAFLGETVAQYAFLDISGRDNAGVAATAQGGFILIIRNTAFQQGGGLPERVVLDPKALNPPNDIPSNNNTLLTPISGYDEPNTPGLTGVGADNHFGENPGVQGVHEVGVSVFFIHTTP